MPAAPAYNPRGSAVALSVGARIGVYEVAGLIGAGGTRRRAFEDARFEILTDR